METIDGKIKYSFKEKYFSLDTEKRIWRRQYFTRSIVPGLLIWLILIPIIWLILPLIMVWLAHTAISKGDAMENLMIQWIIVSMIPGFIYYSLLLCFMPKQIQKRSHDFGSSWILESRLFIGGYILLIIFAIILLAEVFVGEFIPFELLIRGRDIPRYLLIGLYLYLLFRPGDTGSNEYGESPSNVKLWFLG